MAFQTVFKRYELKYLMTSAQKTKILKAMEPFMSLDKYGRTTIRNIYLDTDTYLLARRSAEKPAYKEKIRIRSYSKAEPDSTVFVELKKKYGRVIYKRRISLTEEEAMRWLLQKDSRKKRTQISDEIDYFIRYYETLHPAVFLSYDREAYFSDNGSDFRVTFDDTVLSRQCDISLKSEIYGKPVLADGKVLMEIKCSGGIPLWMTNILSSEHIYETSFSKYGTVYRTVIFPQLYDKNTHFITEVASNA